MIAELLLIVDLLKKSSLRSTPTIGPPVIYDPDYDYRLKENQPKPIKEKMVVDLDPASIAAYQERERIKRALRGL